MYHVSVIVFTFIKTGKILYVLGCQRESVHIATIIKIPEFLIERVYVHVLFT